MVSHHPKWCHPARATPLATPLLLMTIIRTRGGVEDTGLEAKAKAKDTQKSAAKAKDSPSEDRPSRGQGQKCSRPRTRTRSASVLQKKKKKGSQNFFSGDLLKKMSSKFFFRRSTKF